VKKEKKSAKTPFDKILREKDLEHHLKPDGETPKDKKDADGKDENGGKTNGLIDIKELETDIQVNRALDILIGYGVFKKVNG
jgi:hypothetical protein